MKAELKATGTLVITSESEVEAFALKQWSALYLEQNGATQLGGVSILFRVEVAPEPDLMPGGAR